MKKLQVQLTDLELGFLEALLFDVREEFYARGHIAGVMNPDTIVDCTNKVWEAMEQAGWELTKR